MMSEYKIPIIPNLNLEKNDKGRYELNINVGKIKSNKAEQISEIYNIKIDIYDEINIYFEINEWDYCNLFMDEVFSENGKKKFITTNKIKFFDIECISDKYAVTLLNFHSKQSSSDSTKVNMMISGECQECIFKKDNNSIYNDEKVGVWNILECSNTSHVGFAEFESNDLSNVFLKSINTNDYYRENETSQDLKIRQNLQKKQKTSFNQLLGEDSFLYYEDFYGEISDEIIGNIDKLLMFYDSTISPIRMRIIESKITKKLEVIIMPKSDTPNLGNSIFWKVPNNFFDFLNSSYEKYLELKSSDLNIDLLFYYYTWIKNEQSLEVQLVLCSAFMEILKNNQLQPSRNDNYELFDRLQLRIDEVGIDPINLFKYLQPPIYEVVHDIKKEFKNEEFYSDNKFHSTWKMFLKTYVSSIIKFYRNKLLHSGQLKMEQEDIKVFINKWESNFKDSLRDDQQDWADMIAGSLKDKLINFTRFYHAFNQCNFIKEFIDLILLALLDVDCMLTNESRFETKIGVKKIEIGDLNYEVDDISVNSQDYLKKFMS